MMTERTASVFVCDEVLFSLTGKVQVIGMYTQDIVIPSEELPVNQLVFFFTVHTLRTDPFHSLKFRIDFPGSNPIEYEIPPFVAQATQDHRRKQIIYRQPVLTQQQILRPGRIVASVIHERGEIEAGGFWIMTAEEARKAAMPQS
jgi:hypothetical protein